MNDSLLCSIAVISEIHGNVVVRNAVLEGLRSQSYDVLVVTDGLGLNGPRPVACIDIVRELSFSYNLRERRPVRPW